MKPRAAVLIAPAFLLAAPVAQAPAAPARPRAVGLCTAAERPIFSCSTGRQIVSVCAGAAGVHYRAGKPGAVALVSPANSAGLSYANTAYSGGGESQVRFVSGDYAYTVWSGVYRTGFKGTNDPEFRSGVIVIKSGKPFAARTCITPADAVLDLGLAEKTLPEGSFVDHD
jgi:hypothetical protein